jgi:hypothetical protein
MPCLGAEGQSSWRSFTQAALVNGGSRQAAHCSQGLYTLKAYKVCSSSSTAAALIALFIKSGFLYFCAQG